MDTAAPARATRALLPDVLGDDPALARDAAVRLHGVLSASPILTLRTLDRGLREPGQRRFLRLHIEDIDALGEGDFRASLLGIASVQRDGRLREAALSALLGQPGHLALGFVLNRLNDPYPPLRGSLGPCSVWGCCRCW
ncbi:MAG: hypothetical protein ACI8S6_002671 [Myxococcota bacterium]|jgi:hypothetical protein